MSWLDKIKLDLIITTGDSKEYRPTWVNPKFKAAWQLAEFEFPEKKGTLVNRGEALGRRDDLEIYFQGEDHLDTSDAFLISCNDKRAWTLNHPYYGTLFVQPSELEFDNSAPNLTKITGVVIETIIDSNPVTTIDPINDIAIKKLASDTFFEQTITAKLKPNDVNTLGVVNKTASKFTIPIIKLPTDFEKFTNAFNKADAAINSAIASPLLAIRYLNNVITLPAMFAVSVESRINSLTSNFNSLTANASGILTQGGKQIYQDLAGTILSSICVAACNPITGDFPNSRLVLQTIDGIVNSYNAYLRTLDALQTLTGGIPTGFIPDPTALFNLTQMVYITVSNLFAIALNAKSERSIITETDTNIIILTHRLYGLDPLDANIDELIAENNLGLSQILIIKKGTKIVYYI